MKKTIYGRGSIQSIDVRVFPYNERLFRVIAGYCSDTIVVDCLDAFGVSVQLIDIVAENKICAEIPIACATVVFPVGSYNFSYIADSKSLT